jgi:hypothetical protein
MNLSLLSLVFRQHMQTSFMDAEQNTSQTLLSPTNCEVHLSHLFDLAYSLTSSFFARHTLHSVMASHQASGGVLDWIRLLDRVSSHVSRILGRESACMSKKKWAICCFSIDPGTLRCCNHLAIDYWTDIVSEGALWSCKSLKQLC